MNDPFLTGFMLTCLGAFLAGFGYCIRKIWNHDSQLAEIHVMIANMKINCDRHQTWQADQGKSLAKIDRAVTRIATKLDVDIRE